MDTTVLDVESQRFTFDDRWQCVLKYDDTVFYRREATKLQGEIDGAPHSTKAVDLVGLDQTGGLMLLEAKDFRGHRIANKERLRRDEVALEVAVKARDTIAAIVGAARKDVDEFPSGALMNGLKEGNQFSVVLWLEDDSLKSDQRAAKVKLSSLNNILKAKLSWLNVNTFVLSSAVGKRLNGLEVTNLAGAGQRSKS